MRGGRRGAFLPCRLRRTPPSENLTQKLNFPIVKPVARSGMPVLGAPEQLDPVATPDQQSLGPVLRLPEPQYIRIRRKSLVFLPFRIWIFQKGIVFNRRVL